MSPSRTEVPLPTCEKCWLSTHAHWEPESIDDSGNILMRLKGVDVPIKHNTGSVETCHLCGEITISGIYSLDTEDKRVFKKSVRKGFGLIEEAGKEEDYL